MRKILIICLLLISIALHANAQYTTLNAHSHNDYANETPFWLAYNNHFGSIEADIWAIDGELYVAHDKAAIKTDKTLDNLYIQPVLKIFHDNNGKAWMDRSSTFQLLIDLKTTTEPTLSLLVDKLKKYPEIFDPGVNVNAVRVVITGNRPDPAAFANYPEFIFFDGLLKCKYDQQQIKRVALYSENIRQFTLWFGDGDIIEKDRIRLKNVIDSVHSINKKIRFWNCPDNENAWREFMIMGIDYLNTDHIVQLSDYLNKPGK